MFLRAFGAAVDLVDFVGLAIEEGLGFFRSFDDVLDFGVADDFFRLWLLAHDELEV